MNWMSGPGRAAGRSKAGEVIEGGLRKSDRRLPKGGKLIPERGKKKKATHGTRAICFFLSFFLFVAAF